MTASQISSSLIKPAIEEIRASLEQPKNVEVSDETVLIGQNALFDSIHFVALLAVIESLIQEKLDRTIVLASEKAFSRSQSPFRTVGALAAYIEELVAQPASAG
jgi:acyl carrier protein